MPRTHSGGETRDGRRATTALAAPAALPTVLTVDRRGPASRRSRVVNGLLRPAMRRSFAGIAGATFGPEMLAQAARLEDLARWVPNPVGTRVEPTSVGGVRAEWVHGRGVGPSRERAVVYLHGGGWFFCGLNTHRALVSRLSTAAGVPALAVDYRMVPEVAFDDEIGDCTAVYRALLADGWSASDLVVMGDSAGGHLAVSSALRARDTGLPVPAGVVSLSGCLDLDLQAKSAHENAHADPLGALAALQVIVAGVTSGLDVADPAVSPVHADLTGLPPVLLTAGSTEVVRVDAEVMAARLAAAGVDSVVQLWDGQEHVFQAFAPLIPEARASIRDLGAAVRRLLAGAGLHRAV